jgi:hydrogenase maturation protease
MKRVLVYGIGNPYRCDDAVGIRVAEQLAKKIKKSNIDVKWGSIDGVAILDEIVGYDRVIFVDSVKTEKGDPGNIYKIDPASFKSFHSFSSHGINFITAIEFGKKFDLKMPEQTDIYAMEIEDNTSFSEECTPRVAEAIPKMVETIIEEIKRHGN